MLVCDLCLLNFAILVVSGLSEVLGALGRILLSYLVHMHSRLRSLRQGQVHVGPITWEVLPHRLARQPTRCCLLLGLGCPAFPSVGEEEGGASSKVVLPPCGEDVVDSAAGGRAVDRHCHCRPAVE